MHYALMEQTAKMESVTNGLVCYRGNGNMVCWKAGVKMAAKAMLPGGTHKRWGWKMSALAQGAGPPSSRGH